MAKEEASSGGEIMLFGFRVVVDSMRKSVSLNNLSQYEHRLDSNEVAVLPPAGYASADEAVVHRSSAAAPGGVSRERKRGVAWTEEEHKLFLLGLHKVGKGDWRGISRNFVKTRTPTQVASHAQKYFLRKNNFKSKSRRRSSLFDITTDTVTVSQRNDQQKQQINNGGSQSPPRQQEERTNSEISNVRFSYPVIDPSTTSYNQEMKIVSPISSSDSSSMVRFDLNKDESMSLSLNLSLSVPNSSALMQGDSRISVV